MITKFSFNPKASDPVNFAFSSQVELDSQQSLVSQCKHLPEGGFHSGQGVWRKRKQKQFPHHQLLNYSLSPLVTLFSSSQAIDGRKELSSLGLKIANLEC